jgi:CubicO group peptidase (beta-lactamase class C family)
MNRYFFRLLPLLSILLFFCQLCFGQLNNKVAPVVTAFGNQLTADINSDNLQGSISIAILKNGHVIWVSAFGSAARDKNIAADTNTIYRIGSITKTFTATIMMMLVEEGKLKLDDPIENYLPEIKNLKGYVDAGKITFRQLASHTSGLKREPDMMGANVGPDSLWETKLLSCIPNTSFNSKPGQEYLYSNMGYAILGLALSRVSGVPYIQLVQQRIFIPLHMADTFFELPENKRGRLAEGMENSEGDVNTKLPFREINGRGYRVPNGGIFSTPRDLAKFVASLNGGPALLTPKSLRQMQSVPYNGKNYGLGLMIVNRRDLDVIVHNGSVPGYTSQFAIEQQSGYGVILMRNYNKGSTNLEAVSLNLLRQLKQAD